MKRVAALVGLVVLATPCSANAQAVHDEKANAGVSTYMDALDTVIVSPFARASALIPGDVELGVSWNADVISSASVDVITAATDRINETRNEVGVTLAREKGPWRTDLRGHYAYSFEHDGDSHIISAGAKHGFDQDNYELSLGYALTLNRVGVSTEMPADWRSYTAHTLDVGLTRIINARTLAEVMYSLYFTKGYLASPYRRVPIEVGDDLRGAIWVDEVVPDVRWRHAVTGRVRRAFGEHLFGTVQYRFYMDDWGVSAHTERGAVTWELGDALSLHFEQRASLQSAASFYQQRYTMETEHRTRDRRLSPNESGMAGVAVVCDNDLGQTLGKLRVRLGYDAMAWRFSEFSAPDLSITSGAAMQPLGWVVGQLIQFGLELRR